MSATRLMTVAHVEDPVLDMALSHALLREVGRGGEPVVRVLRPGPTLAFGRRDALRPGFARAAEVAREHGFLPVLRSAGGHAVAYDRGSVLVERVVRSAEIGADLTVRFDAAAAELVDVLRARGLEAEVGRLPGEYCAGDHSVHLGGRRKVAGIAQRVVRGAALVTAVLVVEHGAAVRAVIADVYAALGIGVDADVTGAVADAAAGATAAALATDLERRCAPGAAVVEPDAGILEAADALRGRHAVARTARPQVG